MSDIVLDTKLVGAIEGEFYVPSYQRGYRWGRDEVTRLLEDISTNLRKWHRDYRHPARVGCIHTRERSK